MRSHRRLSHRVPVLGLALLSALLASRPGAAPAQNIVLQPVLGDLAQPVLVTHAGDGSHRLFIVEQAGRIKVLTPGSAVPTLFLDLTARVLTGGERGLLGLAFHPRYATTGRFFVNYTRRPDGATVIAEYRVAPGDPDAARDDERILLVVAQPFANHNGGMIAFGPDGLLYVGMGDGGSSFDPDRRAQDVTDLLGKILRLDVADAYAGVVAPDGRTVVFLTSTQPPAGAVTSLAADARTFPALVPDVIVPAGTALTIPDFFVHTVGGTEQPGTYVIFVALARDGALDDGRVDPGDLLALATQPITVGP